jgi:hypothetical protein
MAVATSFVSGDVGGEVQEVGGDPVRVVGVQVAAQLRDRGESGQLDREKS